MFHIVIISSAFVGKQPRTLLKSDPEVRMERVCDEQSVVSHILEDVQSKKRISCIVRRNP